MPSLVHSKRAVTDLIPGGRADKRPASDFKPDQIRKGTKVEKEYMESGAKSASKIPPQFLAKKKKKEDSAGREPPMTGAGKGKGMPGGGRRGRNTGPCKGDGPGFGKGEGRGKGKMRNRPDETDPIPVKGAEKRAAYAMGAQVGFQSAMPSDAAFEKVAAVTNIPADLIRAVYLAKQAAAGSVLPGILGAGLLSYGGLKGFDWLTGKGRYKAPGKGLLGGPHMGQIGGIDPRTETQMRKMIMRSGMRNYQMSELMNMLRASYPMSFRPVV